MVEHRQSEGLPLSVCAEVSLKAKRVDGGDEGLDGVERRAWNGRILGDVAPEDEDKTPAIKSLDFKDERCRHDVVYTDLLRASTVYTAETQSAGA